MKPTLFSWRYMTFCQCGSVNSPHRSWWSHSKRLCSTRLLCTGPRSNTRSWMHWQLHLKQRAHKLHTIPLTASNHQGASTIALVIRELLVMDKLMLLAKQFSTVPDSCVKRHIITARRLVPRLRKAPGLRKAKLFTNRLPIIVIQRSKVLNLHSLGWGLCWPRVDPYFP